MNHAVRLEEWIFVKAEDSESASGFLRGAVFGHPHIPDGVAIQTTNILSIDNGTVQTTNTVYRLGRELQLKSIFNQNTGGSHSAQRHFKVSAISLFQQSVRSPLFKRQIQFWAVRASGNWRFGHF